MPALRYRGSTVIALTAAALLLWPAQALVAGDLLWYWGAAVRQGALCAALLAPAGGSVIAS